jgi:hypothetical protein
MSMSMGFSLSLTGMRASGGGPSPAAPLITNETWNDTDDELAADVQFGETAYSHWSTSATLPNEDVISDATKIQAIAPGENYIEIDDVPITPGTYYLQWGVQGPGGFTQGTPVMQVVTAPGYTETWASYTAGDGNAQLDAAYTISASTPPTLLIQTNANGPAGKSLRLTGTTTSLRFASRDDIEAALAGGFTEVEVLSFWEMGGDNGFRGGIGCEVFTGAMSGLRLEAATGAWNARYMVDTSPNTAGGTSLETGMAAGALRWARLSYYNTDKLRIKWWADGDPEPGSWQADLTSATAWSTALTAIDLITRVSAVQSPHLLGYSVNLNAPAPGF